MKWLLTLVLNIRYHRSSLPQSNTSLVTIDHLSICIFFPFWSVLTLRIGIAEAEYARQALHRSPKAMYEVARVQSEGEKYGFDLESDCSQYSDQALQVDYKGFEALIYRAGRR